MYIFFPGTYGTLDELFTIMILIATKKIPPAPLILVGNEFWKDMISFFEKTIRDGVTPTDYLSHFTLTDNEDEIIDIIRKAPLRRDNSLYAASNGR